MMNRVQTVIAGLLVGIGVAGLVFFAGLGDPMTHRPAFYILVGLAGALLFATNRPA
jgi:uncharacterized membrane protein YuzA (DUF378 family)